jgi:hypothetical protein
MGSESVHEFLSRHQAGNWAEDETSCNESALAHGGIVSSVYLAKEGEIIIGTNLKTNFTKVLLLHEEMNWGDGDDPDVEARRPRNLATAMAFHVDLAALRLSFP